MKKMKLTAAVLFGVLTMGIGSLTTAAGGGNLQAPAGLIKLGEKKPAIFDHAAHTAAGITCGACHHDARHQPRTAEEISTLANGAELACSNCHNPAFANAQLQKRMTIFHASCRDCHQHGVDGRQGPNRCNDCHVNN